MHYNSFTIRAISGLFSVFVACGTPAKSDNLFIDASFNPFGILILLP